MVGPLNVDKYFIGQADFYLERLEDYSRDLNDIVEDAYDKIKIEKSNTPKDQNQINYFRWTIEKTLLQIDVVASYTFDWEIHKEQFIDWVNAYRLAQNRKDCLRFDIDDEVYANSEIDIFIVEKDSKVFYNEFIFDELQVVMITIDEELAKERYGRSTYTDVAKLDGLLEPLSLNTIKLNYLATKNIATMVIDEASHNMNILKPFFSILGPLIDEAFYDFIYNPETLISEKTVSAQSTEESFYVVMSNYDLKVPSRVLDICDD